MSNFKEVEFKYYAHNIPRSAFDHLVRHIGGIKKELCLLAMSTNGKDSIDHYYSNPDTGRFMRWREGQSKEGAKTWELTSKVKLNDLNNNIRTEVNINLNARDMSLDKASEFSSHHGCVYDFSIKKDVQVFWIDNIVLSHYDVFDLDMIKKGTFMEIEADETHEWASEEEALSAIVAWEKKMEPLGINAQKRIKKSLFEFFTNNTTNNQGVVNAK